MKLNIITFAGIGLLVLFAAGLASIIEVRLASAQVDATSSASVDGSLSTATPDLSTEATSSNITAVTSTDGTSSVTTTDSQPDATPAKEAPPTGLTAVHIIGAKYTDYFTDGSTTISVAGDPIIDGHLSDPGAPLPTHEGMTWVHTTGRALYDTPSGDLDVGDYVALSDGSYIENTPPFVSSTSTPAMIQDSTSTLPFNEVASTSPDSAPDATYTQLVASASRLDFLRI